MDDMNKEIKATVTFRKVMVIVHAVSKIALGAFIVGCSIAATIKLWHMMILYILILPFLCYGGIREMIGGIKIFSKLKYIESMVIAEVEKERRENPDDNY